MILKYILEFLECGAVGNVANQCYRAVEPQLERYLLLQVGVGNVSRRRCESRAGIWTCFNRDGQYRFIMLHELGDLFYRLSLESYTKCALDPLLRCCSLIYVGIVRAIAAY